MGIFSEHLSERVDADLELAPGGRPKQASPAPVITDAQMEAIQRAELEIQGILRRLEDTAGVHA